MPLWPFSSRARAGRADRKARKHRAARARADAEWEGLCMTGGSAVPGAEPYDGALRRGRRPRWGSASQSNAAAPRGASSTSQQQISAASSGRCL
jgi:hypothetical protein